MPLTGAQAFVACLREEGVKYVFSVPGGQTLSLLDALVDAPEIRVVTARHEASAAVMADAYGRITGTPAVVIATTGPGATNLVTGVGNAHRDSIPVIVVTVNNNRREIGHDEAQDADHVTLMRQFVKSTRFVPEPENVIAAAREAFRVALSGNPGPAHIDFARDSIEKGELAYEARKPGENRPLNRAIAADADIQPLADQIAAAMKPVIWAGRGVITSGATQALVDFAERFDIPVVATYNGIGAFPGTHRLSLGARSKWGGRAANAALTGADLVIVVGNSLNSISTSRWAMPLRHIVQIDVDPLSIGKRYPVEAGVVGDASHVLTRLGELMPESGVRNAAARAAWSSEKREKFATWQQSVLEKHQDDAKRLHPRAVMTSITQAFGPDAVLIYDAGNAGIWAQIVPVERPRHYMKPVGFGAMGFALPAAIAAKLAQPESPVLAVVGDGSMMMTLGEMETAVRERANIIVLVFNDQAFGNIKQLQAKQFGQRNMGVDVGDTRFADVAKAMGADGMRASTGEELREAFARGLAADGPFVIDAMIDASVSIWEDPF